METFLDMGKLHLTDKDFFFAKSGYIIRFKQLAL